MMTLSSKKTSENSQRNPVLEEWRKDRLMKSPDSKQPVRTTRRLELGRGNT